MQPAAEPVRGDTNRGSSSKLLSIFIFLLCSCFGFITLQAQNINKPNKLGPLGTQVNTFSGNLFIPRTDFLIRARKMDINMLFNYNSYNFNINAGYGNGWSFTYGTSYRKDTSGAIIFTWGDGREETFTVSSGGYTPENGIFDVLEQYQAGKYRLTTTQGMVYYFDNSQHRRLTKMAEPNGNALTLTYTDTLATSITTTAGQTITMAYMSGKLMSVTEANATPSRTFSYVYDATGNLIKVTDPLGGMYQYRYLTNGPMSGITDKNMNQVDIIYNTDFSVSELIGCNTRKSFSYDTTLHKTTVTDYVPTASNEVNTYQYKVFGKQVWLTQLSGNCCGYNNTYDFDGAGNVIKQTDANGNVTAYTYDSKGNLLTITDPLGHTSTYTYSSDFNRINGFTDANGNVFSVTYDSKGNPLQARQPGSVTTTATYSTTGDLVTLTDANNNTYNFTYDTYGNPVQVAGPLNFNLGFSFNARGRLLSITDPNGRAYSAQYDALDRITTVTDPLSHNVTMTYDAASNLTQVKDQKGLVTKFGYDASNRLATSTDALQKQRVYGYDALDNVIRYQDRLGNVSTFTYDTRNRISAYKDAAGNTYSYGYDANGNMTSITYPNGNTVTTTYDANNRPVMMSDGVGLMMSQAYDANGNISSITNANGGVSSLTWDNLNRLTRVIDPLGNASSYTYDKMGNQLTVTDKNNHTAQYAYDARNRVTTFTDANGAQVKGTYDAANNLLTLTDQNNNITTYTYDSLSRTLTVGYANGQSTAYTYDNNYNVTSARLTDGRTINYQYDSANRLITKILPGGNTHSYVHNAEGWLTGATNNAGTVSLSYDPMHRLTAESFGGHTTSYNYNITGRTQRIIYPNGDTILRTFDYRNRLTNLLRGGTTIAAMQYNNANQLQQTNFANGIVSTRQYNNANQITNLSTVSGIQNLGFTYDREGNVTGISRNAGSEQYSYDAGNRLTAYTKGGLQNSYTYNGVGSRSTANVNGLATTYAVNNINQYTSLSNSNQNISFTYDALGNTTYDGSFYKTYDAENRLLSDSSATGKIVYQYDALGRRTQKYGYGKVLKYYYAGFTQIEQRDAATDTTLNETVYGGFMRPLMMINAQRSYYYHPNALNSVEAITDAQGAVAEQYQYDDFGNTSIFNGAGSSITGSAIGNRFGYTGQEYDAETKTYHFPYRNYSPATGSFIQKDPIGYGDGTGIYQYVHNNPGTFIDPFGLQPCPPVTSSVPTEQTVVQQTLYYSGNYSNTMDILNVIEKSTEVEATLQKLSNTQLLKLTTNTTLKAVFNNPVLGIPLTGVNAINTYNSARDLYNGYNTNTIGQNVDGGLSVGTGAISTTLGGVGIYNFATGATVAGTPFIVAGAGGLAIYGLANEGWKKATGESFAETGEKAEIPIFTNTVRNIYGNKYTEFDDYTEQYLYHQQQNNLEQWLEARRKVYGRQDYQSPGGDCPPNGPPGGTQKPPPPTPPGPTSHTEVINSKDPNEIIGPDGVAAPKWVSVKDNLPYIINYENSKSASAPAKTVRIIYPIDSKQDKNTFALGSFGFNNQTFSVPAGTNAYYQRLDVRDSLGLYVDVTAGLDVQNNQAFWFFQSIDPATLLPTTAPLAGFLSLQDTASLNKGHGFVNFTIKPLSTDHTGDTMHAAASIVFDGNDTIPTNYAKNTIDAVAPTSHMNSTPSVSYTNTFPLSWSGVDDASGSGLKSYALYYSVNNGVYMLLRSGITRQDTTFTGSNGNTYRFFVLATDSTGNVEALKSGAEVTVLVNATILPITWQSFTAVLQGKNGLLNWATGSEAKSNHFVVERSVNGRSFTQIGTVAAAGYSTSRRDYRFVDSNVVSLNIPLVYYRIRQVDNDGAFTYSNVVAVPLPTANLKPGVEVYPNPFKQTLNLLLVNLPSATGDNVSLYTIDGKQVYSKALGSRGTSANITLDDLPQLPQGLYLLKITSGTEVFNFKLLRE